MSLQDIKREALRLPEDERAELAESLLLSLDSPTGKEISEDWLLETSRRVRELDEGLVQPLLAAKYKT